MLDVQYEADGAYKLFVDHLREVYCLKFDRKELKEFRILPKNIRIYADGKFIDNGKLK